MEPGAGAVLLVLLGVVLGAVPALAWRISERQLHPSPEAPVEDPVVSPAVAAVLGALRSGAVVLDEDDTVLQASAPAYGMGLVRQGQLQVPELMTLVQQVRRDGQTREIELSISPGGSGAQPPLQVQARAAAMSSRLVLVLAEDRTRERRVETIRRDFVANVSHELKTPVGALTLLAEAVQEAADDPEAVIRFADRMQKEAIRLNSLVKQIIELSRLQGDEAVEQPWSVEVDEAVARAIDVSAIEARAKRIEVVQQGRRGLEVLGNLDQVTLALSNLVANAVAYSPEGSRVVVVARPFEDMVDLTVTDQGIGIPAEDLGRIFERFYRVDPARHRSTGGTGLGLSIVKHVAASHGGEVLVWSTPGRGSSFTLRLPRRTPAAGGARRPASPLAIGKESS